MNVCSCCCCWYFYSWELTINTARPLFGTWFSRLWARGHSFFRAYTLHNHSHQLISGIKRKTQNTSRKNGSQTTDRQKYVPHNFVNFSTAFLPLRLLQRYRVALILSLALLFWQKDDVLERVRAFNERSEYVAESSVLPVYCLYTN